MASTLESLLASAEIVDARMRCAGGAWMVIARSADGTTAGTSNESPQAALERAVELLRGRRA